MTAAAQNLEQTLFSTSLGQSVLDAIVQANIDMNTISPTAVESMMQTEQRRRGELGWALVDKLCAVCG